MRANQWLHQGLQLSGKDTSWPVTQALRKVLGHRTGQISNTYEAEASGCWASRSQQVVGYYAAPLPEAMFDDSRHSLSRISFGGSVATGLQTASSGDLPFWAWARGFCRLGLVFFLAEISLLLVGFILQRSYALTPPSTISCVPQWRMGTNFAAFSSSFLPSTDAAAVRLSFSAWRSSSCVGAWLHQSWSDVCRWLPRTQTSSWVGNIIRSSEMRHETIDEVGMSKGKPNQSMRAQRQPNLHHAPKPGQGAMGKFDSRCSIKGGKCSGSLPTWLGARSMLEANLAQECTHVTHGCWFLASNVLETTANTAAVLRVAVCIGGAWLHLQVQSSQRLLCTSVLGKCEFLGVLLCIPVPVVQTRCNSQ